MQQRDPPIPGRKITMGREHRQEWIVPPLTAAQAEKYTAQLKAMSPTETVVATLVPLAVEAATEALLWNYPDITKEIVAEDLLDMANFHEGFMAAYNPANLPKQAPEAPPPNLGTYSATSMVRMVPAFPTEFDA